MRPRLRGHAVDFIVSGGGARNSTLMAMLAARLEPKGCELAASEEFGMPASAKEAAAFALLAWQTWHRLPGNLPAATGARRPVILGQLTMASASGLARSREFAGLLLPEKLPLPQESIPASRYDS